MHSKKLIYAIAIASSPLLAATAGCGGTGNEPVQPAGDYDEFGVSPEALGVDVPTCTDGSGWDSSTSTLAIDLDADSVHTIVVSVQDGYLTVNGRACTSDGSTSLAKGTVKHVTIDGTVNVTDKVIFDFLPGTFGYPMFSYLGGITLDLKGGTADDAVMVRGSTGVDRFTVGEDSTNVYMELSGDAYADVKVTGGTSAHTFTFSLSDGADIFTGAGGAKSAAHFDAGVTSLSPMSVDMTVRGGGGSDTIQGGDGDDTLYGGPGDDTFNAAASADGADAYYGDDGTDTVSYSARTSAVTVDIGPSGLGADADDGGTGETDDVKYDVENLTGGSGDDTLTGSNVGNTIKGGDGDDTISGGLNGGACDSDADYLKGEAGDDTFAMGSVSDCGDDVAGGTGTDTVDYHARTAALTITVNNIASDGEESEADNIRTDVEVVFGGTAADTITGSSAADVLHGGPGADTLSGGSGNDTLYGGTGDDTLNGDLGDDIFDETDADDAKYTSVARGAGNDIINGGGGTDRVDFSDRSGDLTITLCVDASASQGDSSLTGGGCDDNDGEASADTANKLVNIERVAGGDGDDTITGSTADEYLEGGAGDDTLSGGAGNDTLFGDDNDDTLNGGDGDDYLDGGDEDATDTLNGDGGDGDICIGGETTTTCELE